MCVSLHDNHTHHTTKSSTSPLLPPSTQTPVKLTAGINPKTTFPNAALNILITNKLANAPLKTVRRGCRVAMMTAMRNVLSPISETRIMVRDWVRASVLGEGGRRRWRGWLED